MNTWKEISIQGICDIEKCVGEFKVTELLKTPYGKFKVKIYERQKGGFVGYTNLQLKDSEGCPFSGVGYGATIEEAFIDTVNYFLRMISSRDTLEENDFECIDPFDF